MLLYTYICRVCMDITSISFSYIAMSGITGSDDTFVFKVLRSCQTIFQRPWTLIYPHQQLQGFHFLHILAYAAAAKSLQLCPTLCDPIDSSPLGSPVPGILQARTLEWVAISFSNAWKWKVKVKSLSQVLPLVTPWTAAYQAPPSMGFSRQEYWSGLPLPSLCMLIIYYLIYNIWTTREVP